MGAYTLVIGNKNYSSWSLRPWLAMKMAGAHFQEIVIPLRQPTTTADIARHSPAGKVPVLHHGENDGLGVDRHSRILGRGDAGGAAVAGGPAGARDRPRRLRGDARRLCRVAHAHADEHPRLETRPRPHAGGGEGHPPRRRLVGGMPQPASATAARSCSAGSATRMRCTRRWSPASPPTAWNCVAPRAPTPRRSSPCRRCWSGSRRGKPNPGRWPRTTRLRVPSFVTIDG